MFTDGWKIQLLHHGVFFSLPCIIGSGREAKGGTAQRVEKKSELNDIDSWDIEPTIVYHLKVGPENK